MIFRVTSFLVSVEVETDQNHRRALKIMDDIIAGKSGDVFISDYIFDETVTVTFVKSHDLRKAILVGTNLQDSAEMLKVDEKHLEEAWKLFKGQKDTKFSFTDCTTLVLMEKEGIKNIATFDRDFNNVNGINIIGNS